LVNLFSDPIKIGYVWLQSLEDSNLSAVSEHLLPDSKSKFLSSVAKAKILSSEGYTVDSVGSRCNFPSQTEVLSRETHAAYSVGSDGNLLAPSYSNSIHILGLWAASIILNLSN
jgi:hypothetical protein